MGLVESDKVLVTHSGLTKGDDLHVQLARKVESQIKGIQNGDRASEGVSSDENLVCFVGSHTRLDGTQDQGGSLCLGVPESRMDAELRSTYGSSQLSTNASLHARTERLVGYLGKGFGRARWAQTWRRSRRKGCKDRTVRMGWTHGFDTQTYRLLTSVP